MASWIQWQKLSLQSQICFIDLIEKGDWEHAEIEASLDPLNALRAINVESFLGTDKLCQVTPLHEACSHKAPLSFLIFLCDMNPKLLHTPDSVCKRLPLHVALMESLPDDTILKLIQLDRRSAQGQDVLGRYPLHYACNHGASVDIVDTLIEAYPLAVRQPDVHGWLPLHEACQYGMPASVIQKLLDLYPESKSIRTSKGLTPLMCVQMSKQDKDNKLQAIETVQSSDEPQRCCSVEQGNTAAAKENVSNEEDNVARRSIVFRSAMSRLGIASIFFRIKRKFSKKNDRKESVPNECMSLQTIPESAPEPAKVHYSTYGRVDFAGNWVSTTVSEEEREKLLERGNEEKEDCREEIVQAKLTETHLATIDESQPDLEETDSSESRCSEHEDEEEEVQAIHQAPIPQYSSVKKIMADFEARASRRVDFTGTCISSPVKEKKTFQKPSSFGRVDFTGNPILTPLN